MQSTLTIREEVNMENKHKPKIMPSMKLVVKPTDEDGNSPMYFRDLVKLIKSQGWNKNQHRYAELINEMLGDDIQVNEITTKHVDAIRDHLNKYGRTKATINRYYSALSKCLKYAFGRPEYNMTTMPVIDWEPERNARVRWIDEKEEKKMVKIMTERNKVDYLNFFLFLIDTGLRKGEALKLTKNDVKIDEVSKVMYVWVLDTKNKENRSVPLPKRARAIVETLIENMEQEDCVFNLNYWTIQTQWENLRELMLLEFDKEFTLHALRHTYASRLAQSGKVDFHRLGILMGHKTLQMTKRYSHLMPHHTFGVVDILDNDRDSESDKSTITQIDTISHKG